MCSCRVESCLLSLRLLLLLIVSLHHLLPLRKVLWTGSRCLGRQRRRKAMAVAVAVSDDLFDGLDADVVAHSWLELLATSDTLS